jgi:hypothetical protein
MKKMKKVVLVSVFLLLPLVFLTGCSKVSLTGSTGAPADGEMRTPPEGGTIPEGGTPPEGWTPPEGGAMPTGGPTGGPSNN